MVARTRCVCSRTARRRGCGLAPPRCSTSLASPRPTPRSCTHASPFSLYSMQIIFFCRHVHNTLLQLTCIMCGRYVPPLERLIPTGGGAGGGTGGTPLSARGASSGSARAPAHAKMKFHFFSFQIHSITGLPSMQSARSAQADRPLSSRAVTPLPTPQHSHREHSHL